MGAGPDEAGAEASSACRSAPQAAYAKAGQLADEDVETCRLIGHHGRKVIAEIAARKAGPVNILTHCNAGWLACVDWGTALSPIYQAHDAGVPVHVWVDETRPRNQGAALTAFELGAHGVPHTVIADNAGGHLMQHGQVDLCIVGCDRMTATGDAANKIGTYLKALAAKDNGVPFYVALPGSTIDWTISDGVRDIPIEERGPREVTHMTGLTESGEIVTVQVTAPGSHAANPAFDVTPARLVTGLMTERGVAPATREGFGSSFPKWPAMPPRKGAMKQAIVAAAHKMQSLGLSPGRSGNISARWKGGMLITASGIPPADFDAETDVVFVDGAGKWPAGGKAPSSEWRFHLAVYEARPDAGAVVHCHSRFATALACAHLPIPSFHYMVAKGGGSDIPVAPYATYGTPELAAHVAAAARLAQRLPARQSRSDRHRRGPRRRPRIGGGGRGAGRAICHRARFGRAGSAPGGRDGTGGGEVQNLRQGRQPAPAARREAEVRSQATQALAPSAVCPSLSCAGAVITWRSR